MLQVGSASSVVVVGCHVSSSYVLVFCALQCQCRHWRHFVTALKLHAAVSRLNPFFRTRAGLSLETASLSNKIDAKRAFCYYDLRGICHNDECPS